MPEPSITATTLFGFVSGGILGWPLSQLASRLANRRIPPWATILCGSAACAAVTAPHAHQPVAALVSVCLALTLVLLAAVDVAALRLPDVVTLPLMVGGLLIGPFAEEPFADRLIGAAAGFLALFAVEIAFRRLRGHSGLGLGDAKLFAGAGAWLGWGQLPQVLLLACATGFAWTAVRYLRSGRAALSQPIPFGLGLCIGIILTSISPGLLQDFS